VLTHLRITILCALLIPAATAFGAMTVDDVIRLMEAGVSERVIIAQIEEDGTDFDLSTEDILELEEMGVGERIIEAMIRSGSLSAEMEAAPSDEEVYVEEEVVDVVPSHLGYTRYDHPRSVVVRYVPWSVPHVAYVYADPWYWDPWWWDSYFYVSYHWYPRYASRWYVSWSWASPYYWHGYHYHHWYDYDHYYAHRSYDGHHTYSYAADRRSSWKKKTVYRDAASTETAYRTTSANSYRSKARVAPTSTTRSAAVSSTRPKYRTSTTLTPRSDASSSRVSSSRKRYRSDSSPAVRLTPPSTTSRERAPAAPRSGSRVSGSRSSGHSSPAAPSRSGSSRSGSSSGSSGGKKKSR